MFISGKRANEIGPLAVFRERVEAADEGLLAAGNHTGCETIQAIKKTGADYRKKMQIDENIFTECRIITRAYRKEDVTSTHVQGKPIVDENKNMLSTIFFYFSKDTFMLKVKCHFVHIYFLNRRLNDI